MTHKPLCGPTRPEDPCEGAGTPRHRGHGERLDAAGRQAIVDALRAGVSQRECVRRGLAARDTVARVADDLSRLDDRLAYEAEAVRYEIQIADETPSDLADFLRQARVLRREVAVTKLCLSLPGTPYRCEIPDGTVSIPVLEFKGAKGQALYIGQRVAMAIWEARPRSSRGPGSDREPLRWSALDMWEHGGMGGGIGAHGLGEIGVEPARK